jgi:hypothetical protein
MRNIINLCVYLVILALIGGCAATHTTKREYASPLMSSEYTFQAKRNGDTVEVEKVDDKIGMGYGAAGMGFGRALSVYPAARPARYVLVPNVTPGQRLMEFSSGGGAVRVQSANTDNAEALKRLQDSLEALNEDVKQLEDGK